MATRSVARQVNLILTFSQELGEMKDRCQAWVLDVGLVSNISLPSCVVALT